MQQLEHGPQAGYPGDGTGDGCGKATLRRLDGRRQRQEIESLTNHNALPVRRQRVGQTISAGNEKDSCCERKRSTEMGPPAFRTVFRWAKPRSEAAALLARRYPLLHKSYLLQTQGSDHSARLAGKPDSAFGRGVQTLIVKAEQIPVCGNAVADFNAAVGVNMQHGLDRRAAVQVRSKATPAASRRLRCSDQFQRPPSPTACRRALQQLMPERTGPDDSAIANRTPVV